MKSYINILAIMTLGTVLSACSIEKKTESMKDYKIGTFGYDLQYLNTKDSLVVLTDNNGQAQVIVSPKYQAKVFTSTVNGLEGNSLGYLNYKTFDSKETNEHMNGYGGENRFWIGPEGGRYSVFFESGKEQVYDNWHTPQAIDIEAWKIISSGKRDVWMQKDMEVKNYLGNDMKLSINRKVHLLTTSDIKNMLGITFTDKVKSVAYSTQNTIQNMNNFAWSKETGTICMWMLDMFNTGSKALTIIPFNEGDPNQLGKIATTDYFGEIPCNRIKIKNGILYLKTDGKYRSKLGMSSMRTKSIAANYNPEINRLTITTFDVDPNAIYLNQEWNPEKDPLIGDVLNAYNDGPLEDGSIMGPFLEVESASPAAFLKQGEIQVHNHNVFHFVGKDEDLSIISRALLGVSIEEIKNIF